MKLKHFFLPHPETHQKAHLISLPAIFIYVAIFIILQVGLSLIQISYPGVLGISANIAPSEVVRLVNIERANKGLPALSENAKLAQAAALKGDNMFTENYWAHYSPSGKDPWSFILSTGYKYSYAGENLARNFYDAQSALNAWMASPTHRDNILSSKYKDIGVAVVEGTLNGERTTLIVQEFGNPSFQVLAANPFTSSENIQPVSTEKVQSAVEEQAAQAEPTSAEKQAIEIAQTPTDSKLITNDLVGKPSLDKYQLLKTFGLATFGFLTALIILDLYHLKRRGVLRLGARSFAHLALLGIGSSALINMSPGMIL